MASTSVVTVNVGGDVFQTTAATLSRAGPSSPLSALAPSRSPHFLDGDPRLFSLLLSFLRLGHLPLPHTTPLSPALLAEARHFGLDAALLASLSPPYLFSPLSLRPAARIPLPGRGAASAVALSPAASVVAAHGGALSCFDAALASRAAALTPLPAVDSLLAFTPSLAAAGARDFPGVHLCRFLDDDSTPAPSPEVLPWPGSASATVLSMAATPSPSPWLLASFESARRNASAVVAFDLNSMTPVAEIGRKEVFGADIEAAIPATKLGWLAGYNLLLAAGSHAGPAGMIGDIRLWDVRASTSVPLWEVREKEDCFADIATSDALSALFKVGAASGEVFMADLRRLGGGFAGVEPWVCLGDARKAVATAMSVGRKEGTGCKIECYGNWVFVTRGADVELWSQVALAPEDGGKKVMRRNWLGSGPTTVAADVTEGASEKAKIVSWAFGGSRMTLVRAGDRCVEVWDSAPAAMGLSTQRRLQMCDAS